MGGGIRMLRVLGSSDNSKSYSGDKGTMDDGSCCSRFYPVIRSPCAQTKASRINIG